jgi:hypothetical protein
MQSTICNSRLARHRVAVMAQGRCRSSLSFRLLHQSSLSTINTISTLKLSQPTSIHHHYQTTRSLSISSRWTNFKEAVYNILQGDDHINPKRLLERKYIFRVLIAMRYRDIVIKDQQGLNVNDGPIDHEEQAKAELEALDLDSYSNSNLRKLLLDTLNPQVVQVFKAFDRVDQLLSLPIDWTALQAESNAEDSRNETIVFDWQPFIDMLHKEHYATLLVLKDATETKHLAFLQTKLNALEVLLHFHNNKDNPAAVQPLGGNLDPFGADISNYPASSISLIRHHQTVNICRSALLRQKLGYSILCLRSNIPNAGRGLFVDGSAHAGSLVAFQPGDVWVKEYLVKGGQDLNDHFEHDDDIQISIRFDDHVIDSRNCPVTVLSQDESSNPWALGNMINHPPQDTAPNCQSTQLNFTESMNLGNLMRYIPNTYARQPTWQTLFFDSLEPTIMHSLCLIAMRNVSNEELLYDYRIQSTDPPNWYSIVKYNHHDGDVDGEPEEDQVVFFRDDWKEKPK